MVTVELSHARVSLAPSQSRALLGNAHVDYFRAIPLSSPDSRFLPSSVFSTIADKQVVWPELPVSCAANPTTGYILTRLQRSGRLVLESTCTYRERHADCQAREGALPRRNLFAVDARYQVAWPTRIRTFALHLKVQFTSRKEHRKQSKLLQSDLWYDTDITCIASYQRRPGYEASLRSTSFGIYTPLNYLLPPASLYIFP